MVMEIVVGVGVERNRGVKIVGVGG